MAWTTGLIKLTRNELKLSAVWPKNGSDINYSIEHACPVQ